MNCRAGLVAAIVAAVFGCMCSAAFAVGPGWECVPTAAGQAVTSGGSGSSPSCASGNTPVLAPTYVASGVGGVATVQFSGVNVQVVNGTGSETTTNSLGNLVIGYDPSPGSQTGSHNLVLGTNQQSYTSYGGLVGGSANTVNAPDASVLAGFDNTIESNSGTSAGPATGASISGGSGNRIEGQDATIAGGQSGRANGAFSFVGGGNQNTVEASNASISGGAENTVLAHAGQASITGGYSNVAADPFSMISGGCDNLTGAGTVASGTCDTTGYETVAGGYQNIADGSASVVTGGAGNTATGAGASVSGGEYNLATDGTSSILGGCDNLTVPVSGGASLPTSACDQHGGQTVSGGQQNTASGLLSSVSAGHQNQASGERSSVSGGASNQAIGQDSSVTGGEQNQVASTSAGGSVGGGGYNIASGDTAAVSGGVGNDATDLYGSILGGCSNLTGGGTSPYPFTFCPSPSDQPTANTVAGGYEGDAPGFVDSLLGGNGGSVKDVPYETQVGLEPFGP